MDKFKLVDLSSEEQAIFSKGFKELLDNNSFVAFVSPQYSPIEGTNDFKTTVSLIIQKKVIEVKEDDNIEKTA